MNFFLNEYYVHKNKNKSENKQISKILSIIISIYLCYYIRLIDKKTRDNFNNQLGDLFVELVNYQEKPNEENSNKGLLFRLNETFSKYLQNEMKEYAISSFENFSEILTIEQKFLLTNIEIDKGIGKNKLLRENIFLLFVCLITRIPLIIIGKPGSGKSLSVQLMLKSMRGKFSKSDFFQNFPSLIQSYFQGSDSTTPEDVQNIFKIAEEKFKYIKTSNKNEEIIPISMILFDELGLVERAKNDPLKVLHSQLEYGESKEEEFGESQKEDSKKEISFVGISNWSLDAAKINRTLSLSVPDLDRSKDDIKETSIFIAKSINEEFEKNYIFYFLLPTCYYQYKIALKELKQLKAYKSYELKEFNNEYKKYFENKNEIIKGKKLNFKNEIKFEDFLSIKNIITKELKNEDIDASWMKSNFGGISEEKDYQKFYKLENTINVDFHGNRDFYFLIKGVANDINNNGIINTDKKKITEIIEKYIERNFGGMDIEIDIDTDMEFYSNSFENFRKIKENLNISKKKKKISSVEFFKLFLIFIVIKIN